MPVSLSPRLLTRILDPTHDLEHQLAAMGTIILANLMGFAVIQGKIEMQRHPELNAHPPAAMSYLPKLSLGIFVLTSIYFLATSWRDVREKASRELLLILYANLLSSAAVGLKTQVVFNSSAGSAASIGAVEQ